MTSPAASVAPGVTPPRRIAVIGTGIMGLTAAYKALKAGHSVDLYESDAIPGGMAAHFDFAGLSIERYYHFICKSDQPTFDLLRELGIERALKWRGTSMGYFTHGKVYPWGDPISLLTFPHLDLFGKFRYGLMAFLSTKRRNWKPLDALRADRWIRGWIGKKAYALLWEKLFALKFYEYADDISAAWIWTRIKRIGSSRRSLFQEELGYLEGGSETLVKALVEGVEAMGGRIHLGQPVQRIRLDAAQKFAGITVAGEFLPFEALISTAAIPAVVPMLADFPASLRSRYAALPNIGVVCILHKLRRAVTPHFWLNVNDAAMDIPGIIEFSNLRPLTDDQHLVYVPYYMPATHQKWQRSDAQFVADTQAFLTRINPALTPQDFIGSHVARLRYAQPICPPNFLDLLPNVVPEGVRGVQIADTSYYYPEDRGIAESARIAAAMAAHVEASLYGTPFTESLPLAQRGRQKAPRA